MRRLLRKFLTWLFGVPNTTLLLQEAMRYGKVTMQNVELSDCTGWTVSIRPPAKDKSPRYAWTGTDAELADALLEAVREAREYPDMHPMTELPFAPKLGGSEFDA